MKKKTYCRKSNVSKFNIFADQSDSPKKKLLTGYWIA